MSVDGIGGSTRILSHIYDRTGVGAATPREQGADEAGGLARRRVENRRLARLTEERQAQQEQRAASGDIERLRRQHILNLADEQPLGRGSIVDIEV